MSKTLIGLLFILTGICYGSLAIDDVYNHTLGWLITNKWIKPPKPGSKSEKSLFGPKTTILLYSSALIIIGLFILWNRNS